MVTSCFFFSRPHHLATHGHLSASGHKPFSNQPLLPQAPSAATLAPQQTTQIQQLCRRHPSPTCSDLSIWSAILEWRRRTQENMSFLWVGWLCHKLICRKRGREGQFSYNDTNCSHFVPLQWYMRGLFLWLDTLHSNRTLSCASLSRNLTAGWIIFPL